MVRPGPAFPIPLAEDKFVHIMFLTNLSSGFSAPAPTGPCASPAAALLRVVRKELEAVRRSLPTP